MNAAIQRIIDAVSGKKKKQAPAPESESTEPYTIKTNKITPEERALAEDDPDAMDIESTDPEDIENSDQDKAALLEDIEQNPKHLPQSDTVEEDDEIPEKTGRLFGKNRPQIAIMIHMKNKRGK